MHLWLLLHLAGVVLFVGNIVTATFWKIRADLHKNPAVIHSAVKNVMLADFVFTLPGLVLIILSGIVMAVQTEMLAQGFNWLMASLILFAVTGVVWLAVLLPLQRAMIRYSAACVDRGYITEEYARASRWWAVFGTIATLLPVVILYLMIAKSF